MIIIGKEVWRQGLLLSHGATWMQANVYLVHHGDQKIVVKDFGRTPWLIRHTLCAFVIKREIRALQILQHSGITPRHLATLSDHAYAMEYLEGENLQFKKHIQKMGDILALEAAVKLMHSLGVTHNDLHGKNIIVDKQGHFYFIDFASSFVSASVASAPTWFNQKLFNVFKIIDCSKIAKIKQKFDPLTMTQADNHYLIVKRITSFFTQLWKKMINRPLLRKRTWQRRKDHLTKLFSGK